MECREMLLDELSKQVKLIESQVTHLNVRADQVCHDSEIQQGFTRIKADLKGMETMIEEALTKSATVAG